MRKTTLRISEGALRASGNRAFDERVSLQDIVERALRDDLEMPKGGAR